MIESQKQYDETLDFLKINRFAYDEANEIEDLIEALREETRAAKEYQDAELKSAAHSTQCKEGCSDEGDACDTSSDLWLDEMRKRREFWKALRALPDWLTDG